LRSDGKAARQSGTCRFSTDTNNTDEASVPLWWATIKHNSRNGRDLDQEALLRAAYDADIDAHREIELLASLMTTPDAIPAIRQSIGSHHFSLPGARAVFSAMIDLEVLGTLPTIVTLGTSLSPTLDGIHINGHTGYEALGHINGMDRQRLATPRSYIATILDAHKKREEFKAVQTVQEWLATPRAIRPPMVELLRGLIDD